MINVLYAAVVENQAERNRWMKIKDYADQVSVLTSVTVERFLTTWEEQRVKELVFAMLEELKADRRTQGVATQGLLPQPIAVPRSAAADLPPGLLHPSSLPGIEPKAEPAHNTRAHFAAPAAAGVAALPTEVPPPKKRGRKPMNRGVQACKSCKTTSTPEWRKGPDGRNSLCNACGLRWSKALKPDVDTSSALADELTHADNPQHSQSISSPPPHPPHQHHLSAPLPPTLPLSASEAQSLVASLNASHSHPPPSAPTPLHTHDEERSHQDDLRTDHMLEGQQDGSSDE